MTLRTAVYTAEERYNSRTRGCVNCNCMPTTAIPFTPSNIFSHRTTAKRLAFEIETSKRYLKSNQELEGELSGLCRERDDIRAMFE
jgi:hypothetical protein